MQKGNTKERQSWIVDVLKKNPTLTRAATLEKYSKKFEGISSRTFDKDWAKAVPDFQAYQIKANEAKDKASIAEEVKSLKSGLKSKNDRVMILQNEIDKCLAELQADQADDQALSFGEVIRFTRRLKPAERVALRKTIKELQSEISKIEGDYAPTEIDMTSSVIMVGYSDVVE